MVPGAQWTISKTMELQFLGTPMCQRRHLKQAASLNYQSTLQSRCDPNVQLTGSGGK